MVSPIWLNRDPIEEYGGLNINSFAFNDPISNIDDLGAAVFAAPLVIGGGKILADGLAIVGGAITGAVVAGAINKERDKGSSRARSRRRNRGCTRAELDRLGDHMHKICDNPPQSCSRCTTCAEVRNVMGKISACIDARKHIQTKCYKNSPDAGHAEAIASKENALANCQHVASILGCGF